MGTEKNPIEQKNHDATDLLLKYMSSWKKWLDNTPYWLSHLIYRDKSSQEWEELWWWNIKNNSDFNTLKIKWTNNVMIDWTEVDVSDLWNFLIWYNWYYAWMNLDSYDSLIWYTKWWEYSSIYEAWMLVEQANYLWNNEDWTFTQSSLNLRAFADEYVDRPWYDAWYTYASNEKKWFKNESLWNIFNSANTETIKRLDVQSKLIDKACWNNQMCKNSH
jgi:hypothetical protein